MAQYVSDMSAGNPLTRDSGSSGDTVSLVSTPSNIGGQALQVVIANGLYYGDFTAVPSPAISTSAANDFEMLVLGRNTGSGTSYIEIRAESTSGANALFARTIRNNANLRVGDLGADGFASIGATIPDGAYHWIRLRKRGNQIHGQAWLYGDPEPAAETVSRTHAQSYTANRWAVCLYGSAGNTTATYHIDWISVGTDGDLAPRPKLQEYYVNDSGIWKPVDTLSVRDGGVWKDCEQHVRDGGVWKKVYG